MEFYLNKKYKHWSSVDIYLLPVSHVNSNTTAWHLETPEKKEKKQVGI